jgi:hypothetical protein
MSNSPPPYLYESQQMHWGSPYTAESGDDSQADVTASAMSEATCSESAAAVAAAAAAIVMVQQYTIGLHPSPVDAWKRWARNREWRRAYSVPRWGWLNIT